MNILRIPESLKLKMTTPYDLGLISADIMKMFSHDPKKQTGAAIIDSEYNIYGIGTNAYPFYKHITAADHNLLESNNFDNEHRFRLEHAERNAIAFAIRNENPIFKTIMTLSYTPCVDCANSIANVGIKKVVDESVPDYSHHRWGPGWEYVTKDLFPRCGLEYIHYKVDPNVKDKVKFSLEKILENYYLNSR